MTKYVIDLPDNVSFIVGKGYVLFNEKEFLRIPVKQLEKYSKKEDVEVEKNEEIVYDVRKEGQMIEKYVVSQEFMNELNLWCDVRKLHDFRILISDLHSLPDLIKNWQKDELQSDEESNKRLIAIIRWVNGEDVFEVEKPKKWVVHELNTKLYVTTYDGHTGITPNRDYITKFDTKEEAESWANSHQEVVEVEI